MIVSSVLRKMWSWTPANRTSILYSVVGPFLPSTGIFSSLFSSQLWGKVCLVGGVSEEKRTGDQPGQLKK